MQTWLEKKEWNLQENLDEHLERKALSKGIEQNLGETNRLTIEAELTHFKYQMDSIRYF